MKGKQSNFDKRISTPTVQRYSPGVHIGNWFEDECKYEKQMHKHRSTYDLHFGKPNMADINYMEIWKQKIRGQGVGGRILMFDSSEYMNNFATSYDLNFRVFKKGLTGPIPKKTRADPTDSFGNVTQYTDTLRRQLCRQWQCEKYGATKSEYAREFLRPNREDYVKTCFGIPRENSSMMFKINREQLKANPKVKFVIPTDYSKFPPPPRNERRFEFC